jgi:hypothetical protein
VNVLVERIEGRSGIDESRLAEVAPLYAVIVLKEGFASQEESEEHNSRVMEWVNSSLEGFDLGGRPLLLDVNANYHNQAFRDVGLAEVLKADDAFSSFAGQDGWWRNFVCYGMTTYIDGKGYHLHAFFHGA